MTPLDFDSLPAGADYRHVPDFPGYAVGSDGTVWSCRSRNGKTPLTSSWRPLKLPLLSSRYPFVALHHDGRSRKWLVSRLVLTVFVGPCPPGMQCRHFPDRDPENCRLDNLRWGTPTENQRDKRTHGTQPHGENHYAALLTEEKVRFIRRMTALGRSQVHIALILNVSRTTVQRVLHGKSWKHVV